MFRSTLFWIHLAAGIVCGLVIGVMCFTGTVLAFEKEIIAWAERDARRVEVPADAKPLPLDELQRRFRAAHPEARPMSLVVQNDPAAAVAFSSGRVGGFYVNPYTGEVRQPQSRAVANVMQVMIDWHRYLGLRGEQSRPVGKLINGSCNLAFFVLAITGLYLWMPRTWSWRALRPVIWFRQNSTSKARDFNWHNTIGLWSAPVLIVLTLTAVPISFQWGGRLIATLTGTPQPTSPATPQAAPAAEILPSAAGAQPLPLQSLLAAAQAATPRWETITLRLGSSGGSGPAGAAGNANTARPEGGNGASRPGATDTAPRLTAPITFAIRERGTWPRTATTTLSLHPYTGEVLRRTGYAELNGAQQVRAWTRFLHTGEAVGPIGQFIAGLASLGGVILMWTGLALTWRRFFGQRPSTTGAAAPAEPAVLRS